MATVPPGPEEPAMRYVMLIYNDVEKYDWWASLPPEETGAEMERTLAWFRTLPEGVVVGGDELSDPPLTRTIRRRLGQAHVTDGPFIETKEVLGGFVVLEAESLDRAAAIAAGWPGLEQSDGRVFDHDRVEVRPVVDRP